ncbi:flagellar hook-length control protein FliK [Herbaspirillum sp. NPDC101396]|uniref:flagellar hook-length control protein FliK n=1 Tax=Herbaspirillum sp. NPDC101396 TaxID=3364005 RepID=UPI00383A8C52
MIPRADIAMTVQPVAAVDAPTAIVSVADAKQEAFSRLAQIANGQQLQAKVLSTYNDGSYLVRIANTAARMVLPTSTRTGDTLQLTMVGKDPRPTFLLTESFRGEDEESTEVSLSTAGRAMEKDMKSLKATQQGLTNVGARDNQLDEGDAKNAAPNQLAPESTKTSLSSAGKLVDALLHASEESDLPSAIKPSRPLVANPTSNTPQLADALRDSVALSGAFYESHVAEWADGKRPMAELLKEPQAQLAQQTQSGVASLLNTTDPANTQMGQLINLQLNALEQQRIVWHGEVWPGQQMEWEIHRDSPDQQQQAPQEDEHAPSWHSVVRFNFEHLGAVSASIRLIGQQIHMQVRTDNDVTAAALRANGRMLSESMEAAGSSLDSLIVKRDEQA